MSGVEIMGGPSPKNTTCPECGGQLKTEQSEAVCRKCGLVVEDEFIETRPSSACFSDESGRCGAPLNELRHDRGLSTKIGRRVDGKGKKLDGATREQIKIYRTLHRQAQTDRPGEAVIREGLSEIDRMGCSLGLPKAARETAAMIFREAQNYGLLIGRSIESVGSGALYAGGRINETPRRIEEITRVSRLNDQNRITAAYRDINRELDLKIPVPNPRTHLNRIISDLETRCVSSEQLAHKLIDEAVESGLTSGLHPNTVAGAALYASEQVAADNPLTQKEIANAADITTLTIRNHYRDFIDLTEAETLSYHAAD